MWSVWDIGLVVFLFNNVSVLSFTTTEVPTTFIFDFTATTDSYGIGSQQPLICPEGQMFCLETGTCITPKPCGTVTCPVDQEFCLQTGTCIPKYGQCTVSGTSCDYGKYYCEHTKSCIPTWEPCQQRCDDKSVFCLQTGSCIPKVCDTEESPRTQTVQCNSYEYFCLQTGKCISKEPCEDTSAKPPSTTDTHHCPDGKFFCLQRGMCIDKNSCDDTTTPPPSTDTHHCPDNQFFCLQREMCIDKNSCDDTSTPPPPTDTHHCPDGKFFCLQRGMCIDKNSCDDTTTPPPTTDTHHCPDGKFFCLQRGMCIDKNSCDDTSTPPPPTDTHHCPDNQFFCLQRGMCIDKNSCDDTSTPPPPPTDIHHCPDGKFFCLQRGMCIDKNSCDDTSTTPPPTTDTHHCPDNQFFCLQRGMCIDKNSCDDTSTPPPPPTDTHHCPDGKFFCLQRGMCIDKNSCDDTSTTPPPPTDTHHCPDGKFFCLQRGMCIDKNSCDDTSTPPPPTDTHHCPDGKFFCLQRGMCIDKNSCDDTTTPPPTTDTHHCPDGKFFCLQRGMCIDKNSCDDTSTTPPPTTDRHHCPDNQFFCLQRGMCIDKNSCDDTSTPPPPPTPTDTHHCPDVKFFCLQRGMCIDKNSCDDTTTPPPTTDTHCPDGKFFCLQRGMCIDKNSCDDTSTTTPPTTTDTHHCPDNQFFCLQRGMCIDKNSCDDTSTTPPTTTDTHHCPDGKFFCLQRGMCIDKNSCDDTSTTPPPTTDIHHCPDNQFFCLQRGMCIDKNSCDDTTTPPPTTDTYHCPDWKFFCLQRGMCIDKNSCDDTSTTPPPTTDTHHCPDGKFFCLQRGMCIDKNSCEDTSTTPPPTTDTHHCPDGKFFCLQRGMCIDKNSCDDTTTTPPPTDTHHCSDDQFFCLQRGMCIDKNSCDKISTMPPPPTTMIPPPHTQSCLDNEIFCIASGRCISSASCDDKWKSQNQSTVFPDEFTTPSDMMSSNHTIVCSVGEHFCLQSGKCAPVNVGCSDDSVDNFIGDTTDDDNTTTDLSTNLSSVTTSDNLTDVYLNTTTHSLIDTSINPGTNLTSSNVSFQPTVNPDDNDTAAVTSAVVSESPLTSTQSPVTETKSSTELVTTADKLTTSTSDNESLRFDSTTLSTTTVEDTESQATGSSSMILDTTAGESETTAIDSSNTMLTTQGSGNGSSAEDSSSAVSTTQFPNKESTATEGSSTVLTTQVPDEESSATEGSSTLSTAQVSDKESSATEGFSTLSSATEGSSTEASSTLSTAQVSDKESSATEGFSTLSTALVPDKESSATEGSSTEGSSTVSTTQVPDKESSATEGFTSTVADNEALTTDSTVPPTPYTASELPTASISSTKTAYITSSIAVTSTTEYTPRNLLLMSPNLLTVENVEELNIMSLAQDVSEVTGITYPVYIKCPASIGITWKIQSSAGVQSELTDTLLVTQSDLVVMTTDGSASGLVKCLIEPETTGALSDKYWLGILAVPSPLPNITMLVDKLTINEGTTYMVMSNWSEIFRIELPDDTPYIDTDIISTDTSVLNRYKQQINLYAGSFIARLNFDSVPLDSNNLAGASLEVWSSTLDSWVTDNAVYTSVGVSADMIDSSHHRLQFSSSYNGEFKIIITMQDNRVFRLTIEVIAVNDAPTYTSAASRRINEPVERVLTYPYSGSLSPITVADIGNAIYYDEEGDTISLAFLGFTSTYIGTWEYLLDGNWVSFPRVNNIEASENTSVKMLSPTDTLRYRLNDGSKLWTQREAQLYTKLYALASDGTDVGNIPADKSYNVAVYSCGTNKFCGQGGSSSFSREIVTLYMSREGCDGKPGSELTEDQCGQCGGHDDCVDCMGVVSGGAIIDQCNECTGGTSGETFNGNKHCGGSCEGLNYIHEDLQMCISNTTNVQRLYEELTGCDNVLYSDAVINRCGYCVLGNTNKTENYGIDNCNVCDGDGTSCLDCNNVTNGASVIDACGNCLSPTDPSFDLECVKIASVSPSLVGASGSRVFEIRGANLTFQSVSCKLIKDGSNQEIILTTTDFFSSENRIVVTTPALSSQHTGTYTVSCTFDQEITLTITDQLVTVYDYPVITEVIPDQMTIKQEQNVILRGSGFQDTGYLKCVLRCPYADPKIGCFSTELELSGFILYPAKRLNDSAVECIFTKMSVIRKAMAYNITLMVEPFSNDNKNKLSYIEYIVVAPAAVVTRASIHDRYCILLLEFNVDITLGTASCADILTSESWSYISTTSDIKCIVVGSRVLIQLNKDSTLQQGHTLSLTPDVVRQSESRTQFALYASGNITVSEVSHLDPTFVIVGPTVVGSCDLFILTLTQKGVGCVELTYNWTVSANESNPSNAAVEDVRNIQSKLNQLQTSTKQLNIAANEILSGSAYIFQVTMDNSRENTTYKASITVKRSVDIEPIRVKLKIYDDETKVDVEKVLRLQAVTTLSQCANNTGGEIGYEWKSNTNDFSLADFADSPFAFVKSNSMRGGSSYTISVEVFFKDQLSVSSKTELTITTLSKPLNVRLSGGENIKTLSNVDTVLDASLSTDPDRNAATAYYVWGCEEETSGIPCVVIQNGSSVLLVSLTQQTSSTLRIPANLMSSSKRYKWTVTMIKGDRTGTYTTTVEVIDNLPPTVEVTDVDVFVNPEGPLRVTSIITSAGPVLMYWDSLQDVEGYDYIELSHYVDNAAIFTSKNSKVKDYHFSLYITSQLPPGARFVLSVTAVNTDNDLSATEYIYVTVNSPPQIGDFTTSPNNGTSLETNFVLSFGDGWSDSENEIVSFYLFTRKAGLSWQQLNTRGLVDVFTYSFVLPAGIHDIAVKACDPSMACTWSELLQAFDVSDKVLTTQDIDETKETVDTLIQTGDINKATGMAVSLNEAIDGTSTILQSLVNLVIRSILYTLAPSYDPTETSDILGTLNTLLVSLGSKGALTTEVIIEAQLNAYELAILVTVGSGSIARRRKRAVVDNGGSSVTPMSVASATNILTTYSTTLLSQNIDDITSQSASEYLTVLDNVMIGLCAEVTYAEPATVIQSQLTTLRVNKRFIDTIATEVIDVTCSDCTSYISYPANMTYGTEIQSLYTFWNCSAGGSVQCYGACFASAQMTTDIVTITSSAARYAGPTPRSDIIILKLINPETYEIMTLPTLTTPIEVFIPISGTVNTTMYGLQCLTWNSSSWTNETCTSYGYPKSGANGSEYEVKCSCYNTGILSVFEGPVQEIIQTTEADTTEATTETIATTTTTITTTTTTTTATTTNAVAVPSTANKVYTKFIITADYDSTLATFSSTSDMDDHFKLKISEDLNVNTARITELTISEGSIVVSFALLARTTSSEDTIGVILARLENKVQTGTLTITDQNGQVFTVDTASFRWSLTQFSVGKEATKSIAAIIAGSVAGVVALFVIAGIIVLVAIKMKKKKIPPRVTPSPSPKYGPNMHGIDVPRPASSMQGYKATDMNKGRIEVLPARKMSRTVASERGDSLTSGPSDITAKPDLSENKSGNTELKESGVAKEISVTRPEGSITPNAIGIGIGGGGVSLSSRQSTETDAVWIEKEIKMADSVKEDTPESHTSAGSQKSPPPINNLPHIGM